MKGRGDRIKELRTERQLTRRELGEIAECREHIGAFERGAMEPEGEVLARIAKALCVPEAYLTEGYHKAVIKEQPCWTCAHICDYTCKWAWELRPIPGWRTTQRTVQAKDGSRERLTHINYCPNYDPEEE